VSVLQNCEDLASLLEYPKSGLLSIASSCSSALESSVPDTAAAIRRFAEVIGQLDQNQREEAYAQTFDLNPARCLDLGYQIFGETYKRGAFLVKMKQTVAAHDVACGAELWDHLPVVLRLLPRLRGDEDAGALVSEVVLPAVEKILRTFDDDLFGYRSLLEGLKTALMVDFGITHVEPPRSAELAESEGRGRRLPMFPGFHPPS
jgi:nitrate reductase delta subunit